MKQFEAEVYSVLHLKFQAFEIIILNEDSKRISKQS